MHRTSLAVLTILLLGGAALLSCNDRSGPPSEPDRSLAESEHNLTHKIQILIDAIYGKPGGQNTSANSHWKNIKKSCPQPATNPSLTCQTRVLDLVDRTNDKLAEGQLKDEPGCPDPEDCPGFVPDDTEEAALLLQLFLLQFGGFDVPTDAEDLKIVVCYPGTSCPVILPSEHAGVFLPDGACDVPCVIIGQRTDETEFEPGDGPLNTDLNQFPPFFDWSKQEAGETGGASAGLALAQGDFLVEVEYAHCVVTDGPYAPDTEEDPEIVERLRIAHPDGEGIEIEDLHPEGAPNVPLDCSDVTTGDPPGEIILGLAPAGRRLQPAGGTKLSASINNFSPFVTVDPESGEVETGSISGTVFGCFEAPFGGADVELFEGTIGVEEEPFATTITDGTNGNYFFEDVPVGSYTVRASADGFDSNTEEATVTSGENTDADVTLTPPGGCLT